MDSLSNFTQDESLLTKYGLYNSFLSITVLNSMLIFPVVLGNFFIVFAIQRTPALRTPSNLLLCSLAVSDICVGVFALPLRLSRTITILFRLDETESRLHPFTLFASIYLSGVSVATITAISVDRLLSLRLHLRYNELVTSRRICLVIIKIWVWVIPFTLTYHWNPSLFQSISALLTSVLLIIVVMCYFNIYRIVRRHQRQIQTLCTNFEPATLNREPHLSDEAKDTIQKTPQKNDEISNPGSLAQSSSDKDAGPSKGFNKNDTKLETGCQTESEIGERKQGNSQLNITSLKKTILGSFYVAILFFACSFPYLISKVCLAVSGTQQWTIEANEASVMIIFSSSALNPLIYCVKMRALRTAVYKIYLDFVKNR